MDGITTRDRLFPGRRSGSHRHQRFFFDFHGYRRGTRRVDVLAMCDDDVPVDALNVMIMAVLDFKRYPRDYNKFRALDWLMNVAFAKWQSYADLRKASGE